MEEKWHVVDTHDEDGKIIIWDGDEQAHAPVCDMGEIGEMNYADVLKKAKLIAAAPELISALQDAITGLEWEISEKGGAGHDKAGDEKLLEWKQLINRIL